MGLKTVAIRLLSVQIFFKFVVDLGTNFDLA